MNLANTALAPVTRINLSTQVYETLRAALLEGRLRPRQRLKIRDLGQMLGVSETPVREAVMQLVRERALVLQTSRSLTVPRLSAVQYLELRRIRLELEGLAAAEATAHITPRTIAKLEKLNARLLKAEASGNASDAVRFNWHFHSLVYRNSGMLDLVNLIEGLWLRTGPLLTYQYPYAPPTYARRHRHLDVTDALRAGDAAAVRAAIQADIIEGGAGLVRLLTGLDAGRVDEAVLQGALPPASLVVLETGDPADQFTGS